MGAACSTYGGQQNLYRLSVSKPGGKRPLGRPKLRWEDNIKMDFLEVRCDDIDWIDLVQDRDVADTCECGNEHSGSIKFGEFID
jgi:hypothetical protein